jgi:hypothetical protein
MMTSDVLPDLLPPALVQIVPVFAGGSFAQGPKASRECSQLMAS